MSPARRQAIDHQALQAIILQHYRAGCQALDPVTHQASVPTVHQAQTQAWVQAVLLAPIRVLRPQTSPV